jgi:predicted TIM-barrel fold metal-dependent hydrolase
MPRLRNQLELLLSKAACPQYRPVSVSRKSRKRAQRTKEAKSMQIFTRSIAAVLLIAGGLLGIPAANAQVQPPAPGASDKSANIPDQKLDAAAAAIERVASLKQDYQQRIAAATPADKERILNEAVGALKKAVNDQGLSVEEYDSILEVAQNDPDVREKIRQRIRASIQ